MPQDAAQGKPTLRERLAAQAAVYGRTALYTYLAISLLTITGFSIAIGIGAQPSSASGVFGVISAGWLAAKATMPVRILVTLGATPVIAAIVRWLGRSRQASAPSGEPGDGASEVAARGRVEPRVE